MKIVFDVEKTDSRSGKRYFPGVVYEMSEEKAKSILNQTKYAHIVVDGPIIVGKKEELTEEEIKNLKDDEVIEVKTSEVIFEDVETVENPVENVFNEVMSEITGEKKKKKTKKK